MEFEVDERTLFRFSALTYNTHRIHFDVEWCRKEGYDGLVIHGPLLAFMIRKHMRREGIDLVGKTFGYRFVSPMTGNPELPWSRRPTDWLPAPRRVVQPGPFAPSVP